MNEELMERAVVADTLLHGKGWELVAAILTQYEKDANEELVTYLGTDPNVTRAKQLAVRCLRQVRTALEIDLQTIIARAREQAEETLKQQGEQENG